MSSLIICPRCGIDTKVHEFNGVNVSYCDKCLGMFLKHGELNAIAPKTMGDLEYSSLAADPERHEDKWKAIRCPRCPGKEMKKVDFVIYTDIVLDYCDNCQGFWLDGGEYQRINTEVKKLNETAKTTSDPPLLWFAEFLWKLPFK